MAQICFFHVIFTYNKTARAGTRDMDGRHGWETKGCKRNLLHVMTSQYLPDRVIDIIEGPPWRGIMRQCPGN